jgi:putative transposase
MQDLQAVKSVNAANLGAAASFSRPRLSNDNPFSEAQFKTPKYRPDFPERFDSMEHTRGHFLAFFQWCNNEHRHSGTALALQQQRARVSRTY